MTYYEVELPILFKTDNIVALEDLDLDVKHKLSEYAVEMATFYDISGIAPHYDTQDNNKQYCSLFCCGKEFIVNMSYSQVQSLLRMILYEENEE